jgi:hypothetical protein
MRLRLLIRNSFGAALVFVAAASMAAGQPAKVETKAYDSSQEESKQSRELSANEGGSPSVKSEPEIWLYLVGGRQMQVDEIFENADGIWFKVGNVTTLIDRNRVERVERRSNLKQELRAETLRGSGSWSISDSARVEKFYLNKFGRPLPLTALGQSDLHTRWGYDHRQGMDIGLHPDSREGKVLIEFLRTEDIPFLAFREAVPGVATGPHIHVGNPSRRLPVR